MSTKPKKPKARRMWANPHFVSIPKGDIVCFNNKLVCVTHPVAVIDVSDEAALIEVVAAAICGRTFSKSYTKWKSLPGVAQQGWRNIAAEALTALGVLPKRRKS
jgi:hypothetical protein